ncbi:hypothetical protein DFJ73DRAFT_565305 [Zopfochytrium polystomum]|nr:hypothetical protein DFJ73DRAFT_565305 [Zopfochytrium polystomum]
MQRDNREELISSSSTHRRIAVRETLFFNPTESKSTATVAFLTTCTLSIIILALASLFGVLFAFYVYAFLRGAFGYFGAFGTGANYVGYQLCALVVLITCPTTVQGLRVVRLQKLRGGCVEPSTSMKITEYARNKRHLAIKSGYSSEPVSKLRRCLPCIDWTFLEPGTWGLTYIRIIGYWLASFSLGILYTLSILGNVPTFVDDTLMAVGFTLLGSLTAFSVVVIAPSKSLWQRAMRSLWISFWNMVAIEVGRFTIAFPLFLALFDREGLLGPITVQATLETISLFFCFFLPDVPRFRLVLLRSLAPTALKIPCLVDPSLIADYPLLTSESARTAPYDAVENFREYSTASSTMFGFSLCVRMICCTASRVSLLLVLDNNHFTISTATGLVLQWVLAAYCLWSAGRSTSLLVFSDRGEKLPQIPAPIPPLAELTGLNEKAVKEKTRAPKSGLPTIEKRSTLPARIPTVQGLATNDLTQKRRKSELVHLERVFSGEVGNQTHPVQFS